MDLARGARDRTFVLNAPLASRFLLVCNLFAPLRPTLTHCMEQYTPCTGVCEGAPGEKRHILRYICPGHYLYPNDVEVGRYNSRSHGGDLYASSLPPIKAARKLILKNDPTDRTCCAPPLPQHQSSAARSSARTARKCLSSSVKMASRSRSGRRFQVRRSASSRRQRAMRAA